MINWFPEKLPEEYHDGSYETTISWTNSMVYSWLSQLISVGYTKSKKGDRKGLQESDVKNVKSRDKTSERFADFEKNWENELARIAKINEKIIEKRKKSNKVASSSEEETKDEDDFLEKPSLYRKDPKCFLQQPPSGMYIRAHT